MKTLVTIKMSEERIESIQKAIRMADWLTEGGFVNPPDSNGQADWSGALSSLNDFSAKLEEEMEDQLE